VEVFLREIYENHSPPATTDNRFHLEQPDPRIGKTSPYTATPVENNIPTHLVSQSQQPKMADNGNYAPRSPDFNAYQPYADTTPYHHQQQQQQQLQHQQQQQLGAYSYGYAAQPQSVVPQETLQFQEAPITPAPVGRGRGRGRVKKEEPFPRNSMNATAVKRRDPVEQAIQVKTKFPVARIKRIMQADEDVGKVAQVSPSLVCKSGFKGIVLYASLNFLTNTGYSQSFGVIHDITCH
jgi:hypothetical protein